MQGSAPCQVDEKRGSTLCKDGRYFVTLFGQVGTISHWVRFCLVGGDGTTRMFVAGMVTVAGLFASIGMARAAEPVGRYAIVVRSDIAAGPWGKVVRSLEAKYKGKAFAYDKSAEDMRRNVDAYHPR